MICCHVLMVDKFTVFSPVQFDIRKETIQYPQARLPASVMAETHRKRLSTYDTLMAGVEDPQKMRLVRRHTTMK